MYYKSLLFIGLAALVLVGAGCGADQTDEPAGGQPAPVVERDIDEPTVPAVTYTAAEVVAHAAADDCWVIVDGLVYDVTALIETHSGGPGHIEAACGTDASDAFATKGDQNKPHSDRAIMELDTYYLAPLAN